MTHPWQTTRQTCNQCGHVQVCVHPSDCEYLECSVCHHMNPAPYVEPPNEWRDNTFQNPFWTTHGGPSKAVEVMLNDGRIRRLECPTCVRGMFHLVAKWRPATNPKNP